MVKKTEGEKKGLVESVVNRGAWTAEEDRKLVECVRIHGHKKWRTLPAKAGLNRCGKSCRLRWLNYLRPGIKKGDITEEEEDLIIRLHNLLGNRWSLIAGRLPGRTDNEIKNHWNTHLRKRSLTIDDLNLKLNQKKESSRGLTCTPLASSHGFSTMMDPIEDWILGGAAEPLQLPPELHLSEIGTAPEQLFDVMPNPNGNGTGGSTGRGEFGFEGHGSRGQDGYQDLLVGDINGTNSSEGCSSSHALAAWDAPQFDDLGRFIAFENVDSYFLN